MSEQREFDVGPSPVSTLENTATRFKFLQSVYRLRSRSPLRLFASTVAPREH